MRANPNRWKDCIPCKGKCCRWETVLLGKKEIETIKKHIKKGDFYLRKKSYNVLKQKKNGYCVFYDEKKHRCAIHKLKPFDCELFPFDIRRVSKGNFTKKGKLIWVVWTFCPVIKKMKKEGNKYKEFLKSIDKLESKILKRFTKEEVMKYSLFFEPEKERGKPWELLRIAKI